MQREIDTAEAMEAFGEQLAHKCVQGTRLYFRGDLGAGKTTLVRGFLRGRGYAGKVKSPTYTLVEPYELDDITIFHFDLYRLNKPEELDYIGFRDYFDGNSIVLLEWPEKAASQLIDPDLLINITLDTDKRTLKIQANSQVGEDLLLTVQRLGELPR
ncbi:MAG: tRNA threonylcarbamoyladenosine biosynthesis protein TsaE [Gammaproteobacteria bacterium]|jgi:tRNA threonylcarbamoyladenosine biosynthesis protein TsaE